MVDVRYPILSVAGLVANNHRVTFRGQEAVRGVVVARRPRPLQWCHCRATWSERLKRTGTRKGSRRMKQHYSDDRCPSVMRNELSHPCFLLHRSRQICFWLSSDSTPKFLKFLPFFVHCCFCWRYFHRLRHRNKFVYQWVMMQWITSFSRNMVFMNFRDNSLHTQSLGFICFQNARKFWLVIIFPATGHSVPAVCLFTRHGWCCWNFQLPLCIFSWYLWIPFPQDQWNKFLSAFQYSRASVFFICPILLFLHFWVPWPTSPDFWPQMIWPGCCLSFR